MKELNLLLIIAREKDRAAYEKYFSRHALASYTTLPCRGTAQNKTLDLLGIEQTEKTILLSVIGKHSLVIYMLHQPVVYGVLWLVFNAS